MRDVRLLLVVGLLLQQVGAQNGNASCPTVCDCTQTAMASCNGRALRQLPLDLNPTMPIFRLDLSMNHMTEMPGDVFKRTSNLTELHLDGNIISSLSKNASSNQLKILSLRHNQVLSVSREELAGFPVLESLDLEGNMITDLHDSTFIHQKKLRHLNLANNFLTRVGANALKGLFTLQTLKLGDNQVNNISTEAFRNTPALEELDLASNHLDRVPYGIIALVNLRILILSKNRIERISSGVFQHLNNLERLEVKTNPLIVVDNAAFKSMPGLQQLIVSEASGMRLFPNLSGTDNLEVLRLDRAHISSVPNDLCTHAPKLRSLQLKGNALTSVPDVRNCSHLRLIDLGHNEIGSLLLSSEDGEARFSAFSDLRHLHDVIVHHNNITQIESTVFKGIDTLQILDLSHNHIEWLSDDAFADLNSLEDLNLGGNSFSRMPTQGLRGVQSLKAHNNPSLTSFPGPVSFPKVRSLTLSYAYHCCAFLPSTYENILPEYGASDANDDFDDFNRLKEAVFFPGEGNFDHAFWHQNGSSIWSANGSDVTLMWENLDLSDSVAFSTPAPGIECTPAPGPFLPCNDLFNWWSLRCSVWIVFLLALLGNGCVVIVLIASRSKMDVPRFLVCNLAMADFFMGLYLGFLALVDAATIGEFRRFALPWQFSFACQLAGFFGVLSSELSVFTLAVITLERNYAITHAMHLNKRLSLRHAAYIMAAGWSFALIMASLPLFGISDFRQFAVCLPFDVSDAISLAYVIFLMLANGVAFAVLMGCYLKMYCAIRGSQAWNSNDSRIARRMALLVFTDFLCWAPIAFFSLSACMGVYLISLEQAKVLTVFVLPLNSCCNPFLYAILTKQFKKDCVMICKAIEESRVTRGIGRCRHSSNFSNRQTPANTNSLQSGSGQGGQHQHTGCSCNGGGQSGKLACKMDEHSFMSRLWPWSTLRRLWQVKPDSSVSQCTKETNISSSNSSRSRNRASTTQRGGQSGRGGPEHPRGGHRAPRLLADLLQQQHSDRQTSTRMAGGGRLAGDKGEMRAGNVGGPATARRHESVSSDNFSSSRSDSWRQGQGGRYRGGQVGGQVEVAGGYGQRRRARRNSWTVTRKASQDSQSSRRSQESSGASSNSTQTWRISHSSVSSNESAAPSLHNIASRSNSSKFSVLAQRAATHLHQQHHPGSQVLAGHANSSMGPPPSPKIQRLVPALSAATAGIMKQPLVGPSTETATSKPRLTRQNAAMVSADGESSSSAKSVTFAEPANNSVNSNDPCPVHASAEYIALLSQRYRSLYNKLLETNPDDEESDMEASDADEDDVYADQLQQQHEHALQQARLLAAAAYLQQQQLLLQQQQRQQRQRERAENGDAEAVDIEAADAESNAVVVQSHDDLDRVAPSSSRLTVGFVPRKLSTISSKGSFGKEEDEEEEGDNHEATIRAVIENNSNNQDDDDDADDDDVFVGKKADTEKGDECEKEALLNTEFDPEKDNDHKNVRKPYLSTDV